MKNLFKFIIVSVILLMIISNYGLCQTTYYSKGSLSVRVASNWNTARDGSGTDAPAFGTNNTWVIQNGHQMFMPFGAGTWNVGTPSGTVIIENGGSWVNNAVGVFTIGTFIIYGGGTYYHNTGSGTIPGTIRKFSNSTNGSNGNGTYEIQAFGNSVISSGITWGNVRVNRATTTQNCECTAAFATVEGNFIMDQYGTHEFILTNAQTTTHNISGDLIVNGGILNLKSGTEDIIFNIGGNLSVTNGTLTSSASTNTVTVNLSGNFLMSGGTLSRTSTGLLIYNFNKSGIQMFTKSAGTISGAAMTFAVLSGSTLDMGDNVLDNSSGAFNLNSGATLKTSHADGIDANGVSGSIQVGTPTYSTEATYVYYKSGSQNTGTGLPQTSFTGLTVGSTDNATNLTINNATSKAIVGGTLTLISNNTSNSTIASGTIEYGVASSTLKYQGASSQTTTNTEFPSSNGPYSLTIDNANGVTLHSSRSINGILTLTSGLLTLGANNLTLGSGASVSGTPTSTNMIVTTGTGELRKVFTGTGSFTFPVGDNTGTAEYSPVTVNFATGTFAGGAYAGVNLRNEKHPNNTSVNNFINRYWTLTSSGITSFTCSPTFTFLDADVGGTEGNKASLYTGQYNSGWILRNQVSGNNLSATNISSFSDFTGGDQGALPVSLQSFSSLVSGNYVKLNWITAIEENNAGFNIERINNSELLINNWVKIGFVKGNGTKNSPTSYSFEDKNLQTGKYKYRLKQIDYNGNYEYFELNGEVEVGVPKKFDISQNYPNPFNPVTKINFDMPENGRVDIRLYDMLGREVAVLVNEVRNAGYHTVQFDASKLSSGIYFYKMNAGKFSGVKKMSLIK